MNSIEWLIKELEEQKLIKLDKLSTILFNKNFATRYELIVEKAKEIHKQEQEKLVDDALTNFELGWADRRKQQNLYTEKEVRKAIYGNPKFIFGKDQAEAIIQSLKQPKQ